LREFEYSLKSSHFAWHIKASEWNRLGSAYRAEWVISDAHQQVTAEAERLTIDYYAVSFDDPPQVSPTPADSVVVAARASKKKA
jgi:hypothetical protein